MKEAVKDKEKRRHINKKKSKTKRFQYKKMNKKINVKLKKIDTSKYVIKQ